MLKLYHLTFRPIKLICPPPRPEAKKNHFRPGGWAFNFWHLFRFSMCYPKGAHSLGHRWLQLLTFGAFRIQLQIFNVLPQGGSFVYSPLAAITHFLGHFGFSFKFSMCYSLVHLVVAKLEELISRTLLGLFKIRLLFQDRLRSQNVRF